MCLILLDYRRVASHPVVVAANREEAYARSARSPAWVEADIFAGQDARAGGTWLGVSRGGVLAAVTNRRRPDGELFGPPDPGLRSRGQLCLDVLRQPTAAAARDWALRHLESARYNPFNLLLAGGDGAFVVHGHGAVPAAVDLAPGLHVLTDRDVDADDDARGARARMLAGGGAGDLAQRLSHLPTVLADHDAAPDRAPVCRHGERSGTVSSCLVALTGDGLAGARFLFAPGPPCTHAYGDLSAQVAS